MAMMTEKLKIGIVGFGREGKSAYNYWKREYPNAFFFIYDKSRDLSLPDGVLPRLGDDYLNFLVEDSEKIDLIVKSPGIAIWEIENKLKCEVTTVTNEFFKQCKLKNNNKVIGVTGTKGKGTTATLIYEILKADGKDVYLVGNIGTSALDVLENVNENTYIVYELSSFQLYDIKYSPHIAVCLLITEDHLDWHKDVEHYRNAKENIFKFQSEDDFAIYYAQNKYSSLYASRSSAKEKICFGETLEADVRVEDNNLVFNGDKIISVNQVKLLGKHNWQNIEAAIAATYNLVQVESIQEVLSTFSGLPYHIENVGTKNGVTFINDSFSVNPTSTGVAIDAFSSNLILLLGGVDRGLDLEDFTDKLIGTKNIMQAICYGEFGQRLFVELQRKNYMNSEFLGTQNFDEIFKHAVDISADGEVVLFSPAAPSFDMFENYIKRGEKFNELVAKL